MLTLEEASSRRQSKMLSEFVGFGTLWDVLEHVWQRAYPKFDRTNKRKGHPGVVVSDDAGGNFVPSVAMLVGTSKRGCRFSVPVEDVYGCEPGRKTWFSSLPPLQIPHAAFFKREKFVEGNVKWSRHCAMRLAKSRATPGEIASLRKLMAIFPWGRSEDGK